MQELIDLDSFINTEKSEALILVTVIATRGSSYKKAGAKKVIAPDGSSSGLISGGCLEGEIVSRALKMKDNTETHVFDTFSDDDRLWGTGTGCQGEITLKFEKTSRKTIGARLREEILEKQIHVHVIGAGPDLDPLNRIFSTTGWCTRFYTADSSLLQQRQQQNWQIYPITHPKMDWVIEKPERTALLLMSHNYPLDLDVLSQVVDEGIKYIGVLGPEKRKHSLLQDLERIYQKRWPENSPTLIEGPLGIKGLGKGELAIAVSATARLQQVFFGEAP